MNFRRGMVAIKELVYRVGYGALRKRCAAVKLSRRAVSAEATSRRSLVSCSCNRRDLLQVVVR